MDLNLGHSLPMYMDLSLGEDHKLRLLADLLSGLGDHSVIAPDQMRHLGMFLNSYLDRKEIREHVFLKKPLGQMTLSDVDVNFEIKRLRHHLNKF